MRSENQMKGRANPGILAAIAAAVAGQISGMGAMGSMGRLAPVGGRFRPQGKQWRITGHYMPAGPRCNVKGTYVRNPKIAAQVNAMHAMWETARGF